MSSRKSKRERLGSLCGESHPDDGVDPRRFFGKRSGMPPGRKTLQLCAQVARAVGVFLAECGDEVLRHLLVASVTPSPGPESLLVTLEPGRPDPPAAAAEALARIERAGGRIRWEVGASITRKRVPLLRFRIAARGEEER